MKSHYVRFEDFLKEKLKDPEFKKAYAEPDEDPYLEIAFQLLQLRRKLHLTQKQLAKKVGTSQQALARLESTAYKGCTIKTLDNIAKKLHKKLRIQFV